jgi:hypothetical protein
LFWVTEKLLPSFEVLHPNRCMVLCLDNAPYHHKRAIGSMNNNTKKELVQLCINHNIETIIVDWNNNRIYTLQNSMDDNNIRIINEYEIELTFNEEKKAKKQAVQNLQQKSN